MGDLKTVWPNPVYGDQTDLGGDLPTDRGGDPLIDTGGASGLMPVWTEQQSVPTPGGSETPNSLSGLPTQPARFQPSDNPPQPPGLTDRNPGTIDQK